MSESPRNPGRLTGEWRGRGWGWWGDQKLAHFPPAPSLLDSDVSVQTIFSEKLPSILSRGSSFRTLLPAAKKEARSEKHTWLSSVPNGL